MTEQKYSLSPNEKFAVVLDRTCLECFCSMTQQEYRWYEGPRV